MALMARGHRLEPVQADSLAVLMRAWRAWRDWLAVALRRDARQPFSSVLPVRTLRSDVEPTNFVARLGFYAMDKCTPLMAGSWNAVKAGADAPPSAAVWLGQAGDSGRVLLQPFARLPRRGCFHGQLMFLEQRGGGRSNFAGRWHHKSRSAGLGYNLILSLTAGCSFVQWFEALETGCARIARYGAQAPVVSLALDRFANDPISKFTLLAGDCSCLNRCPASVGLPTVFVLKDGCAAAELGT